MKISAQQNLKKTFILFLLPLVCQFCLTAEDTNIVKIPVQRAATSDPIDNLVADFSDSHGLWSNGLFPSLNLPETALPEQVIKKNLEMSMPDFNKGNPTNYTILKIRHLQGGLPDAALVQTGFGEKIVLFYYAGPTVGWWSRNYDASKYITDTQSAVQNSDFSPFKSIVVSNDVIVATLPAAPRWFVQVDSAESRQSEPGESFTMQAGSSLRLVDKHSSYDVTAQLAPTPGLKMESTFNASDFGRENTKTNYFIPAK